MFRLSIIFIYNQNYKWIFSLIENRNSIVKLIIKALELQPLQRLLLQLLLLQRLQQQRQLQRQHNLSSLLIGSTGINVLEILFGISKGLGIIWEDFNMAKKLKVGPGLQ